MLIRFIVFFLAIANISSCQSQPDLHPDNYKIFGRPGALGLQDKDGNIVLDTVFMFMNFGNEIDRDEYYLTYKKTDGRRGMYVSTLDQPYFELGEEVAYFDIINSWEYFAFGGPEKDRFGNYLEGVITKDGEVIIQAEYRNILYYGGKHFFGSNPEDKLYSIIDMKGEIVPNRGRYAWVSGKHGVTFANKSNAAADIWGAKGCLLDEEGREVTPHIYQKIAIFKSPFHEQKVYVSLMLDGWQSLYRTDGTIIYEEENQRVGPISTVADQLVMNSEYHGRVDRNIVGAFKREGVRYYLTYEGEALEASAYQAQIGL